MKVIFHVPPANQGQIVEVSYAGIEGYVIKRKLDYSDDRATRYFISKALVDDDGDYWNGRPLNKRWKEISAAEAERLIAEEER